ncbi:MAG: sugar ABC transporter substrate-binding protein [Treponema sp.]|jgi:multiple sugar transport system substrate-binding protein|nr:sugar ABC transporter substrate-binding protein [Treponema sp.]
MKRFSREIVLCTVIACVSLLPACSRGGQGSTGGTSGGDGKRQVRFANWWGDHEIELADRYFKTSYTPTSGIEIIFDYSPYDGFIAKMISEMAAGTPADLVLCNSDHISSYARNDLMLGLNEYMQRDSVDLTTFFGTPDWIIDGELYGLPSWYGAWYMYVNVTMLEKAGIEVPRGSWTWDQFRDICLKVADPANGIWGLSDAHVGDMYWYTLNGGSAFNDDMTKCTINSPEVVYTFEFLKRLIYQDKVAPEPTYYQTVAPDVLFRDGKAAFHYNGTWAANFFRVSADRVDFTWDVIFAPTGPMAKGDVTPARSSGMFIPANAKNIETSWEVMKHWGSVEGINNIDIGALSSMPPSQETLGAEAYNLWPSQQPEHFTKEFFAQVTARAKYFPFTHYYMSENVQNAWNVSSILRENLDIKTTLDSAYNTIMANWATIEYIGKK